MPNRVRIIGIVTLGLALSACANAERFQGQSLGSRTLGPARAEAAPELPSAPPVRTEPVETQALPPPPGAASAPFPPVADAGSLPQANSPGLDTPPPAPRAIETPTMPGQPREIAALGDAPGGGAARGGRGPVSSRDGVIGGWTAREATGGACRVVLSSSPALDLYRASSSGCANRDLQRVTAWDYRDGEVYLYQPGGAVAARLRVNDGASLAGVIARSGAALSMSR